MTILLIIYGILGIIVATALLSSMGVDKLGKFTENKFIKVLICIVVALIAIITWPCWVGAYLSRFI